VETAQQFDLVPLVAARYDDGELLAHGRPRPARLRRRRRKCGASGGFLGEAQLIGDLGDQLLQALAELLLFFGERGQRVDRQEQRAGLFLGDVEHFHFDLHVGVDIAAQMAVDQLEPAVGQLVDEQAAGEADFLIERSQSGTLVVAMIGLGSRRR
jgi:hypothetical protein